MRNIIAMLAIAMTALPTLAANTVKATVNGMVCAFCAQGIEKTISRMDTTKAVFVDLKAKVVLVEAKDGGVFRKSSGSIVGVNRAFPE